MCILVQECTDKAFEEGRKRDAVRMIQRGYSTEEIEDITELSEEEIEELRDIS